MEARRLVFIRRKDDPPSRRGVAIPIYDHSDWDSFTSKCCEKLKIPGVGAVHLASTGEPITRLDQLQDIDDLVITETTAQLASTSSGPSAVQRGAGAAVTGRPSPMTSPNGGTRSQDDESGEDKYHKRRSALSRTLKPIFPSLFASSNGRLPVTTKDVGSGAAGSAGAAAEGGRKQRRRRSRRWIDPRTALVLVALLCCLAMMLLVYNRTVGLRTLKHGP